MKRRDALKSLLSFIPLGVAGAGFTAMGIRFISPVKRKYERRIFTLHLDELPINESKLLYDLKGRELMMVRTGEKEILALSTVCTHLGCSVKWQKDKQQFYCPCHNAVFDKTGQVLEGPPPAPLDTYHVEIDGENVFIYYNEEE